MSKAQSIFKAFLWEAFFLPKETPVPIRTATLRLHRRSNEKAFCAKGLEGREVRGRR
jgi:hypothetical protein